MWFVELTDEVKQKFPVDYLDDVKSAIEKFGDEVDFQECFTLTDIEQDDENGDIAYLLNDEGDLWWCGVYRDEDGQMCCSQADCC
jgi:hypothetical protein